MNLQSAWSFIKTLIFIIGLGSIVYYIYSYFNHLNDVIVEQAKCYDQLTADSCLKPIQKAMDAANDGTKLIFKVNKPTAK
ncbi:hypothetical protein SA5R_18650 [Pantoea dispersa]|uniref:Uncharacterized protein n=1 Tax=Pantoea dispersa TaxID=59814 RepID=A0A8E1S017_9GAMM|nr:hypothetical protein SA2_10855 [Pantoea dispersa]KTS22208.1 hypothetical protein SA4R_11125 [Pantoea dispersa]KTS57176.1 hypothetical protein SA5R_18650 [Pantoea dispersa]KTS68491.1 hypothetical protein SA3R_07260 [Pantoea dispersa]